MAKIEITNNENAAGLQDCMTAALESLECVECYLAALSACEKTPTQTTKEATANLRSLRANIYGIAQRADEITEGRTLP